MLVVEKLFSNTYTSGLQMNVILFAREIKEIMNQGPFNLIVATCQDNIMI